MLTLGEWISYIDNFKTPISNLGTRLTHYFAVDDISI